MKIKAGTPLVQESEETESQIEEINKESSDQKDVKYFWCPYYPLGGLKTRLDLHHIGLEL